VATPPGRRAASPYLLKFRSALTAVAETLRLNAFLDDQGPPIGDSDYVYAVHLVRHHLNASVDSLRGARPER